MTTDRDRKDFEKWEAKNWVYIDDHEDAFVIFQAGLALAAERRKQEEPVAIRYTLRNSGGIAYEISADINQLTPAFRGFAVLAKEMLILRDPEQP